MKDLNLKQLGTTPFHVWREKKNCLQSMIMVTVDYGEVGALFCFCFCFVLFCFMIVHFHNIRNQRIFHVSYFHHIRERVANCGLFLKEKYLSAILQLTLAAYPPSLRVVMVVFNNYLIVCWRRQQLDNIHQLPGQSKHLSTSTYSQIPHENVVIFP